MSLTVTSPTSSFSAYVAWAQKHPNLTEEHERMLLRAYSENSDLDAVKQLLLSHLKYVISIASGYLGYGLPIQDLVQEGNIGLMRAVKRFDMTHAVRLATFAVYWIKSEIHEYIIRNWRIVKIATTKAQRKLFFRLRKQLNYEAKVHDNLQNIALKAGVSLEDARHMHMRMMHHEESLESRVSHQENDVVLGDMLSLPGDNPSDVVATEQTSSTRFAYLKNAMDALNERERWIIQKRWMIEDAKQKPTLDNVAQHLGVSVERARQLEAQALKRMKKFLDSNNVLYIDI